MNADIVLVIENGNIIKSGSGIEIIPSFAKLKRAYKCSSQNLCNLKSFKQDSFINFTNDPIKLEQQINMIQHRKNKMYYKAFEDHGEHGIIDLKVYKYYCFSIGYCLSFLTIVSLILTQGK
jgi:hypothetical protein